MQSLSHPLKPAKALMIFIVLGYFFLVIVLPIAGMFAGAFAKGLSAVGERLIQAAALHALWLTLIITAITVVLNSAAGLLLALLSTRHRFPGSGILDGIINIPFAVSPVIAGYMLIIIYGPNGLLGWFFASQGWKVVYALPGMVLATLFVTLPFVFKEVSLVLQEIGIEQEEAAALLGANPWQVFWQVTFPGIRWGLMYGITLTIARSLGEFGAVLVVSGNIINLTQSATLYIYQSYADFDYISAYAVAAVLALVSFLILICLEFIKRKRGVNTGGYRVAKPDQKLFRQ